MSYERITYQNFSSIKPIPLKKGYRKIKKRANYRYDALNRITSGIDNTGNYNLTNVSYDKNGNITHLERKGHTNVGATSFGVMDNLVYTYETNSNKLKKVLDNGNDTFGFKDGANQTTEYTYDTNGNLLTDANKGITSISYNHLNMPTEIKFDNSNTKKINYVYAADRTKLRKTTNDNGSITTTDYSGNFVYENNTLKQFYHAEGYVEPNGSSFQYVYQLKDIWRNVRITYADDDNNGSVNASEIRREQNYYPFGLEHQGYNSYKYGVENNLKTYQSQEFTADLDLNTHEWKFRMSDPAIGRFWQIDPLAEDYTYNSTYAFQENKLGIGIELEGLEVLIFKDQTYKDVNKYATHPLGVRGGKALDQGKQFVVDNKSDILNTANTMQDVGDGIAIAGYAGAVGGSAFAGIGAAPGASVALFGNTLALLGSGIEILTELITGDNGAAGQEAATTVGGLIIDAVVDRVLPGPTPDISKEATTIIKENINVKTIIIERVIEEKTKEEEPQNN